MKLYHSVLVILLIMSPSGIVYSDFNDTVESINKAQDSKEIANCSRIESSIRPNQDKLAYSNIFSGTCAKCHGIKGEGKIGPSIQKVDFETFLYSVRSGRLGMPSFDEASYSSDLLTNDYRITTGRDPDQDNSNCKIQVVASNLKIDPALNYDKIEKGPKALGLGFGIDPLVLPYIMCKNLPSIDEPGKTENVCGNVFMGGSTKEGYKFGDLGVCKDIRTQRPFSKKAIVKRDVFGNEDERLGNETFRNELEWVTSQIRSNACVCCHDSSVHSNSTVWDINKNKIWTDQLTNRGLAMFSGQLETVSFGAYPPEKNFGFDRYHTVVPTTDVPRMQAYFNKLIGDLRITASEIANYPPVGGIMYQQLYNPIKECPKGVGIDAESLKITWSWYAPARYIYVLEAGAQSPLVPPNLDMPDGTMWRIDVPRNHLPLLSGAVTYGETPARALQTIPDPSRFEVAKLEKGKIYRLNVQLDMAFPVTNCYFKF